MKSVPIDMWTLYMIMMESVAEERGSEFLQPAVKTMQVFIATDAHTLKGHLCEKTVKFACKILANINTKTDHFLERIAAIKVFITLLENVNSSTYLKEIAGALVMEFQLALKFDKKWPIAYKSMVLQAIVMCFYSDRENVLALFGKHLVGMLRFLNASFDVF